MPDARCRPSPGDWLAVLRPSQWTKNAAVGAAFLFALGDRHQQLPPLAAVYTLAAVAIFCMLSSAVYLLNDVCDAPRDRLHPLKRRRPVAAGRIPPGHALAACGLLVLASMPAAWLITPPLALTAAAFLLLNIAYSLGLKRVALLDVLLISFGFVLRAMGGAAAIRVEISPWLLLCALMLALFLALCKRRHEKLLASREDTPARPVLNQYHPILLDHYISIVSAAAIVCYALYTLWPETVAKFGSYRLGFTVPFVIYGIFRYLQLVYRDGDGERPEMILLRDRPTILNLLLYGLAVVWILLVQPAP